MSWILTVAMASCCWAAAGQPKPVARPEAPPEDRPSYVVKAEFLMHFIEYVEWPSSSMPASSDPWVIGVVDPDEVYGALLRVTRTKTIRGRPVAVRLLAEPGQGQVGPQSAGKPPHVLYFSPSSDRSAVHVPLGVLTVSDDSGGEGAPVGIISFVRTGDRVRFDVALEAAERAGLKLSSRMLQVAHRVVGSR